MNEQASVSFVPTSMRPPTKYDNERAATSDAVLVSPLNWFACLRGRGRRRGRGGGGTGQLLKTALYGNRSTYAFHRTTLVSLLQEVGCMTSVR